jgi:hypothetical protein
MLEEDKNDGADVRAVERTLTPRNLRSENVREVTKLWNNQHLPRLRCFELYPCWTKQFMTTNL